MSDEKVVRLPVKPKGAPRGELTIVSPYGGCSHTHFLVDERASEVTCRDCGEKLNPIWALGKLAQHDSSLIQRWAHLSAHVKLLEKRVKVKCTGCQKMVTIPTGVSEWKVRDLAERIRREEGL
jgi:ribosomal protein S27E